MLAQATSAESANERGRAIVALRAGPRSMDAVVVLAQVAHTDESPRNRIAAVAALRALAAQGDEDNLIKGALQRASLDSDRRVAAGARSALSQVREGIDVNLYAEALLE
jgi:hypothetical protein